MRGPFTVKPDRSLFWKSTTPEMFSKIIQKVQMDVNLPAIGTQRKTIFSIWIFPSLNGILLQSFFAAVQSASFVFLISVKLYFPRKLDFYCPMG